MGDYPAQFFRYGYAVSESPTEDDKEALEHLEKWYFNEIAEENPIGHGGADGGLTCVAGDSTIDTGFIVGIPIRADECVADADGHAYLGGLHAAQFDAECFIAEVERAKQRYSEDVDAKIKELLADYVDENAEPSVVTASAFH